MHSSDNLIGLSSLSTSACMCSAFEFFFSQLVEVTDVVRVRISVV